MAPLSKVLMLQAKDSLDVWSTSGASSTPEEKEARKAAATQEQTNFKAASIVFYGLTNQGGKIQCMVSGEFLPSAEVHAAHLLPKASKISCVLSLLNLGYDAVNHPRNSLLLAEGIERSFDKKELCFEPVPLRTNTLKCRVLNPILRPHKISASATLTFADIEGKVLLLPPGKKPYMRVLSEHYEKAMEYALRMHWIPETEERTPYANWSPECRNSPLADLGSRTVSSDSKSTASSEKSTPLRSLGRGKEFVPRGVASFLFLSLLVFRWIGLRSISLHTCSLIFFV